MDKQQFIDLVFSGYAEYATGPLPPSSPYYNPDVERYEHNVELANQMLDDAGYPMGTDGTRFSLRMNVGTTGRVYGEPEMEALKDQLKDVGIDLVLEIYDEATGTQKVYMERDFDMYLTGGLSTAPDPNMISGYLHSDRILDPPIPSLYNVMGFDNARVDELFELGRTESNVEKRGEYYDELQEIIVDQLPAYYLVAGVYPQFYWDDLVGVPAGPYGGGRERLDDAFWMSGNDVSEDTASETIANVETQLVALEDEGYNVIAANAKLNDAIDALDDKEYDNANALAKEVLDLAEPLTDVTPDEPTEADNTMYYIAAVIIAVVAIAYFYMKKQS